MKMVRSIVRPECADDVADALAAAGFTGLTRLAVVGRGRQHGITAGTVRYDELPKVLLLTVVEDDDVESVATIVATAARTGHVGDGKIFVSPVEAAYTVRTGAGGL